MTSAVHAHTNSGSIHRPQQYFVNILYALIATTLILVMTSYLFLDSKPPTARMNTIDQVAGHYLRNQEDEYLLRHDLFKLSDPDEFFSSTEKTRTIHDKDKLAPSFIWGEEFFAPLLESPLLQELKKEQEQAWMNPKFEMNDDEDQVSLRVFIPDISLENIEIEVIGGRVLHIHGEQIMDTSQVSFDNRYSIGSNLDESNLKAKLNKDGMLVVTAPKVASKKEDTRKIPVVYADEL